MPNPATQEIEQEQVAENEEVVVAGGGEEGGEQKTEPTEAEARAHRMGWRPKEEYEASGRDGSKWVDAETFIRRGEETLPILKDRLRKADRILENQGKQIEEGNKLLRDLVTRQNERTKQEVEKAVNALKAERREAARDGDVDRVEALSEEIRTSEDSLKKLPEPPKPVETNDNGNEVPAEVISWAQANPWFNSNAKMRAVATAEYGELMREPGLSETERLAKVKAEVMRRFPEHFRNPNRAAPPAVESGSTGGGKRGEKGWNDIPAEDRALGERLIRQGAVKDRTQYAKDYFRH